MGLRVLYLEVGESIYRSLPLCLVDEKNARFDDSLANGGTFIRWVRDRGDKICIANGPRLYGSEVESAMEGRSCYLQFTITDTGYKSSQNREEGTVFVESAEFVPESDDRIPEGDYSTTHSPQDESTQGEFEQKDDLKNNVSRRKQ